MASTPRVLAISGTESCVFLKCIAEVREITRRPWMLASRPISSSVMPSGPFLNPIAYSAWVAANNFTSLANQYQTNRTYNGLQGLFGDSTLEVVGTFNTFMNDYNSWALRSF